MFGLSDRQYRILCDCLSTIKEHKLFVFGSRARGDHKEYSDIDILVDGEPDPRTLSQVKDLLEESSLLIKVDLVLKKDLLKDYAESVKRDCKEFHFV
jgi:predicted nucleotidyltransferase